MENMDYSLFSAMNAGNSNVLFSNVFGCMLKLQTIVDYCLKVCVTYKEVKPVYDMLIEVLNGCNDREWLEAKAKLKKRMADLERKTTILCEGAELVMEKHVGCEVKNVEAGGVGVTSN